MLTALVLLFTSCAIGYHDDETFNSGVRDTQLESPDLESGLVVRYTTTTEGEGFKFEWPVVYGASGYEFSLYNIDDPNTPVVIGPEGEIVDGCTVTRPRVEDTKYKVVIRAIGDEKYNNTSATNASQKDFSTLVKMYKLIPSGTDLGLFFQENPIPDLSEVETEGEESVREIAYDLEAGGEYTMSADIALKLTTLTIRANKLNRAKLKVVGNSSFISDGAGFKLKWIDLDMGEYTGAGFVTYNPTQNPKVLNTNGWVTIEEGSQILSSHISNLKKPLLHDSKAKYVIYEWGLKDCIIEQNTDDNMIHFETGAIKDLRMTNSTFSNKKNSANFFIRYGGVRFDKDDRPNPDWATAGVDIRNCTFWQISYKKDIFNSNGFGKKANYVTLEQCIFANTGKKLVARKFAMNNNRDPILKFKENSYWYDGAFATDELGYDKSETHLESDPQLVDPANGNFTVRGADHIAKRVGDPRWLPAVE